jgi:hypothetical protein
LSNYNGLDISLMLLVLITVLKTCCNFCTPLSAKKAFCRGNAGGGSVKVSINGEHQATDIQIDASVMNDKDMLEDLILSAINDAIVGLFSSCPPFHL